MSAAIGMLAIAVRWINEIAPENWQRIKLAATTDRKDGSGISLSHL